MTIATEQYKVQPTAYNNELLYRNVSCEAPHCTHHPINFRQKEEKYLVPVTRNKIFHKKKILWNLDVHVSHFENLWAAELEAGVAKPKLLGYPIEPIQPWCACYLIIMPAEFSTRIFL